MSCTAIASEPRRATIVSRRPQPPHCLPLGPPQYHLREEYATPIAAIFARQFQRKTAEEWEAAFARAQVPSSATRTTQEWLHSEHARASGLVHEAATACVRAGPTTPAGRDDGYSLPRYAHGTVPTSFDGAVISRWARRCSQSAS